MPLPPPVEEFHPALISALTKLVVGMGTIVVSLVGTLYWLLRSTDTKQQDQLDEGADQFTVNAVEIERLKKDLESVRAWMVALEKELDEFELKRLKDHEEFLLLKDHHKRNHHESIG